MRVGVNGKLPTPETAVFLTAFFEFCSLLPRCHIDVDVLDAAAFILKRWINGLVAAPHHMASAKALRAVRYLAIY